MTDTTIEENTPQEATHIATPHKNWRELRKRNLILTCLPKGRYQNVLELACSTGMLSAKLADRAHQLACCDSSENALNSAIRRMGRHQHVRFLQRRIPEQWPEGRYDLIVINDLAKRLTPVELADTTIRIRDALAPAGSVLACHWRTPREAHEHHTADQVHETLNKHLGDRTLHHVEPDILLDIWQADPA
ncbi:class I SAM-dependent methyltransferase [Pseudomonas sp. GD03944]|uniref:class I SAM-dependent DNA methyltransferase n=1 Tax=Pseudomonas sp. GD03944 TaxID=2975409 RepID=UPI00244A0E4A|nr:class I SAM-dependent methyltransferase [Pseudomonas sp. GD03944]MDH1265220.1 class I SAM-dependent methyltransferase [Pseudomonas sp. GD03944]